MARSLSLIASVTGACLALSTGCGGKHPGSYTNAAANQEVAQTPTDAADALWEQRVEVTKLEEALAAYAAVVEANPGNAHALERLTRGWYLYGESFSQDKEVKIERWATAIEYGTQCIGLNLKIAQAVEGGTKEKDAVAFATEDNVPCLYWTASALGRWGKIQGLSKTLKHLPTVKAYISKVEELDATYFHYGPARYWAVYYAALPSFAGQDMEQSAEYFKASIAGAPYYLPTRALRAEFLAVGTQDVGMFDRDLVAVLGSNPDARPEADVTPENIREREKARVMLGKRAELFDADALEAAGPAPEEPPAYAPKVIERPETPDEDAPVSEKTIDRPEDAEPETKTIERPEEADEDAPVSEKTIERSDDANE